MGTELLIAGVGIKVKPLLRIALILAALAALAVSLAGQNTGATSQPGTQSAGTAPNQVAGQADGAGPQGHVVRILSPPPGARLHQDFINAQYELTNPGVSASSAPNFMIQLDNRDPVTTNSTSYTFTGLKPGAHTLTVQVVDANGTPVAGARTEAQFVVLQPAPTPSSAVRLRHRRPSMISAALRVEEPQDRSRNGDKELPSAAGALPLLSVIGFGVLLGGIASAMKTRPK